MNTYFEPHTKEVNAKEVVVSLERSKYNVMSLFSGCGGMDLGFLGDFNFLGERYQKLPYNIIFANDIFSQAADVYEANLGHKVVRESIEEIKESEFPDDSVDVILGGFPCQTFSYSGNRKGMDDPRGLLYKQMIRAIKHYEPKMFVAENVDGIRNSRSTENNIDNNALDIILKEFRESGYNVQYKVLNAADYGVPQRRRRVIIIGIREDLGTNNDVYYPEPTHAEHGFISKPWVTAKDAIDELWGEINNPKYLNHTIKDYSKAKFYPGKKMQGNNRIAADRPAPTIRAEHHGNIEAHYRTTLENKKDMNGWRRLSIRECARLQSFPDDFNFVTSASAAYKMIGNAVPPLLAWHIATGVYYTLTKVDNKIMIN